MRETKFSLIANNMAFQLCKGMVKTAWREIRIGCGEEFERSLL
jgi:hypothetical protein